MLKRLVCLIALAATACVPAAETLKEGSPMPASIVDPYLKIQESLAKDSLDGVPQRAGEIATAATTLGAPAVKIDAAAVQLASATEIEDARTKFGTLSDAIVAFVDDLKLTLPEGIRVAKCSMKQKPWLQAGADIANPYYGASMLTCGDFR